MCKHVNNKRVIAMNVFGRIMEDKGELWLTTHSCVPNTLVNVREQLPLLFELLMDISYRKYTLELEINTTQHMMFKIKKFKKESIKRRI